MRVNAYAHIDHGEQILIRHLIQYGSASMRVRAREDKVTAENRDGIARVDHRTSEGSHLDIGVDSAHEVGCHIDLRSANILVTGTDETI